MIPRLNLPDLSGLGDRWEAQVKARFGRDADTYVPPTADEFVQTRTMVGDVATAVRSQDGSRLALAADEAARMGFELVELDTPKERFMLLQEKEGAERGWGRVLMRLNPQRSLTVEVPHPVFDAGTPELGLELFADSGADALLLAGAHRWNLRETAPDQSGQLLPGRGASPAPSTGGAPPPLAPPQSKGGASPPPLAPPQSKGGASPPPLAPPRGLADPAHSPVTFFQAAHQALVQRGETVLQVHGFKPQTAQDPEIYLSDGLDDGHDPPGLVKLNDTLQNVGFKPFIVDFKEDRLTARTNVQLQDMANRGLLHDGEFIHMELSDAIRKGPQRETSFGKVREAVQDWLRADDLRS